MPSCSKCGSLVRLGVCTKCASGYKQREAQKTTRAIRITSAGTQSPLIRKFESVRERALVWAPNNRKLESFVNEAVGHFDSQGLFTIHVACGSGFSGQFERGNRAKDLDSVGPKHSVLSVSPRQLSLATKKLARTGRRVAFLVTEAEEFPKMDGAPNWKNFPTFAVVSTHPDLLESRQAAGMHRFGEWIGNLDPKVARDAGDWGELKLELIEGELGSGKFFSLTDEPKIVMQQVNRMLRRGEQVLAKGSLREHPGDVIGLACRLSAVASEITAPAMEAMRKHASVCAPRIARSLNLTAGPEHDFLVSLGSKYLTNLDDDGSSGASCLLWPIYSDHLAPLTEAFLANDTEQFLQRHRRSTKAAKFAPSPRGIWVESKRQMLGKNRQKMFDFLASREKSNYIRELQIWQQPEAPQPIVGVPKPVAAPDPLRLIQLLELEHNESVAARPKELESSSYKDLEKIGVSKRGFTIERRISSPNGLRVSLRNQEKIRGFQIDRGATVAVSLGDEFDSNSVRGKVQNVQDSRVEILLPSDAQLRQNGRFRLDLLDDSWTHEKKIEILKKLHRHRGGNSADPWMQNLVRNDKALCYPINQTTDSGPIGFLNAELNSSQKAAVGLGLAAERCVTIQGPPGTGKTTVLVELAHQAVLAGLRVLVCAETNAAVDNAIEKFRTSGGIGHRQGNAMQVTRDHLRAWTVSEVGEPPKVVFSTVSACAKREGTPVDIVILDEGSQCNLPAAYLALQWAPKIVAIGDHLQLGPVVMSDQAAAKGLAESILDHLVGRQGVNASALLDVQYRMKDEILQLANVLTYQNRIKQGRKDGRGPSLHWHPYSKSNSESRVRGGSIINLHEAELMEEAYQVARERMPILLSPYRAQVELLLSRGLPAGTVDSFQGSESEVVLLGLTRSNDRDEVGFLKDKRRLNVAMTRAKNELHIFYDAKLMGQPVNGVPAKLIEICSGGE